MVAWVAVIAIATIAGGVHGLIGLGFPMIATPLLALLTDLRTAIVLTILPSMAVQVVSIIRGGHWSASLGRFWQMPLYFAAGAYVGTRILIVADPKPFVLLLVVIILAYVNLERLGQWNWRALSRHPRWWGAVFACSAGFFEGTANASAPPLVIFYSELRLAPTAMVQAMNLCFLSGKAMQLSTLAASGGIAPSAWAATSPVIVTAVVALIGGSAARSRVDTGTYRLWLRRALLAIATLLVIQFVLRTLNVIA
jgi:uncharacterized protein